MAFDNTQYLQVGVNDQQPLSYQQVVAYNQRKESGAHHWYSDYNMTGDSNEQSIMVSTPQ